MRNSGLSKQKDCPNSSIFFFKADVDHSTIGLRTYIADDVQLKFLLAELLLTKIQSVNFLELLQVTSLSDRF